ncbi:uncharacterized protein JCM6883_003740 [Sporobolomyces salmoneus]|uniref:uncharacterized protein n=1 Tax=Sporobolomyces salmoneus TaxID=183962 RepID=UPI003176E83D
MVNSPSTSTLVLLALSTLPFVSATTLQDRATYTCSVTADCTALKYAIPANSHYYCAKGTCSWACNTNYVASGTSCVRKVTSSSTSSVVWSKVSTTTTKALAATTPGTTSKTTSRTSTTLAQSQTSAKSSNSFSSWSRVTRVSPTPKPTTTSTSSTTTTTTTTSTTSTVVPAPTQPAATPSLVRTYQGKTFFDNWWWLNITDPTHGSVNYLAEADSKALGLTTVSPSGTAIISIDRTSNLTLGSYRNSARISTLDTYNAGSLIIIDLKHVPWGCGTWPAFWMFQTPWPDLGEIDVYEGIGSRTFNQMTLHTSANCTRNAAAPMTGVGGGTNCYAYGGTSGCTVYDYDPTSYGAGFNAAGGGVFAVQIAETGISIWRWKRSSIPSDIQNGAPRPRGWGTPVAQWDGSTCDTRTFFKWQMLTFDTTTCGEWQGVQSVWEDQWQSGNCYPKYPTCAHANADPANFSEAYFEVNYIKG